MIRYRDKEQQFTACDPIEAKCRNFPLFPDTIFDTEPDTYHEFIFVHTFEEIIYCSIKTWKNMEVFLLDMMFYDHDFQLCFVKVLH